MAVNFCNPAYGITVAASSVSADGYEPQNLLKPGMFGLWKGFLAEHFIKPPLNITFALPFDIDIHSIAINPSVGSHRSSGIEIFSARVLQGSDSCEKSDSKTGNSVNSGNARNKTGSSVDSAIFTNIGKVYCQDSSPHIMQFVNRRYRSLYEDSLPVPPCGNDADNVLRRDLKCGQAWHVNRINHLVIRITRVQGGSVPALKKVEIWGQPSPSCGKIVINKILSTAKQLRLLAVPRQPNFQSPRETSSSEKSAIGKPQSGQSVERQASNAVNGSSPECPEEFFDPITCEVMVIPILLPSGHTVDKDTLDKHNRIEATWGRPQNDPFTGVPFSSVSKPIPNVNLKARIDKFLLSGGDAVKGVPRTAGKASKPDPELHSGDQIQSSVLLHTNLPSTSQNPRSTAQNSRSINTHTRAYSIKEDEACVTSEMRKKRKLVVETFQSGVQYPLLHNKKSKIYGTDNIPPLAVSSSSYASLPCDRAESHEMLVSNSLNDALASTLASLPSYSKPSSATRGLSLEDQFTSCVSCKTPVQDSETVFYKMPCGHLICRNCVSNIPSGILCPRCKKSFTRSELSRVHSS
ncbi:RING finger protein 37-like [Diadema antillarum]|uniref:RING finger protein 37-like n=1 Tax=Diadema antillarum TaxID=105358 RepID=UPI003A885B3D